MQENRILFKKEEIKLIVYGIVASAYMTIVYDLVQEFMKTPIDWNPILIKLAAGLLSMVIGICVISYLTRKTQ